MRGIKNQPEEEESARPPSSEKECFKEQQVPKARESEKSKMYLRNRTH